MIVRERGREASVRLRGILFPFMAAIGNGEEEIIARSANCETRAKNNRERERERERPGRDGGSELSSLRSADPPQLPLFYCPIVEERARAR